MKRKYELTVLLSPTAKDGGRDKFEAKVEKILKVLDGKVVKAMEMGKKQLAYKINDLSEAIYVNFVLEMPTASVVQLDKKLVVDKEVIRHLLVSI
jgi:small subunit ribosomal protein S6